jgi:hypothetical protein
MVSFAMEGGVSVRQKYERDESERLTVVPRLPSTGNGELDPTALDAWLDYTESSARVAVAFLRDASDGVDDIVSVVAN